MPKPIKHPSENELSAFALGDLPLDLADRIEQHISECETCCETIVGLAADDTFIELLKKARIESPLHDETHAASAAETSEDGIPKPLRSHSRYEIEQLVGRGGMGRVYKARHRMMDRAVALKVIHREWVTNQEAIDRFHREMKSAASLDHPNIVTAYDAEQADGLHFLVMEYVDGVDLSQTVKQRGPLRVDQACDFIRQAAEGLQHAHEKGMVHRDIKPHNLIVTKDNVVKILDFGLASLSPQFLSHQVAPRETESGPSDGELTIAGTIMGTPDFISPEQAIDARGVDGRSDIYSLGMTFYFLLAGRVPFVEGTAKEKLQHHASTEPTPLAMLREDIPPDVRQIVSRMTAKDPCNRFQSPNEVVDAIDKVTHAEPATAAGPSRRGSLLKWLGAAVLIALTTAAMYAYIGRDEQQAKADYEQLKMYLETGQSEENHSRISDRMLRSKPGRRYLRILDAEHPQLAFTEGQFALGYTSVVAYVCDRDEPNDSSPNLLIRGRGLTVMGMRTQSFYKGFSIRSIRFDNGPDDQCKAVVQYTTGDAGTPLFGLQPHSIYETKIRINELIEGDTKLTELLSQQSEYLGDTSKSVTQVGPKSQTPSDRSTPAKAIPFKLSQLPGDASLVIGCRPRRILQDARFSGLKTKPLPVIGIAKRFIDEDVDELLHIERVQNDVRFTVHVITVENGSAMKIADRLLGMKEPKDTSAMEGTVYETHHVDGEPILVRMVDRKTVIVGTEASLTAHHAALQELSNQKIVDCAAEISRSVLFTLADAMTEKEYLNLRHMTDEFDLPPVKTLGETWMNSEFFGVAISLDPVSELQVISCARNANTADKNADQMRSFATVARELLKHPIGNDLFGIDATTAQLITEALDDVTVAIANDTTARLVFPFGFAEKPLLSRLDKFLDAGEKQRELAKSQLQSISLAFHKFHDRYGYFPSVETKLPSASQPVSWRVAILPFLDQKPLHLDLKSLFDQYNLDEPWDSENNKKLLTKVPEVYRHPNAWHRSNDANYVVFVGETATGSGDSPVRLDDITDGSSGTIMIAECATAIPWTKPEDLVVDPSAPLPPIGDLSRGGWYAAFADGWVHFIPSSISDHVVKALITRSGNEPVKREGESFMLAP